MEDTTNNIINNNNNNKYKNIDSNNDKCESKDEVDFVIVSANNNNYHKSNNNNNNKLTDNITPNGKSCTNNISNSNKNNSNNNINNGNITVAATINTTVPKSIKQQNPLVPNKESKKKKIDDSVEKKTTTTKERLSLFSFNKKISQKQCGNSTVKLDKKNTTTIENKPTVTAVAALPPRSHKFVKSASIARLLGNTYNAKKFEKNEQKRLANDGKFNTYAGGRRRLNGPYLERFRQCSKEDGDEFDVTSSDLRDLYGGSRNDLDGLELPQALDRNADFGTKAMRTISRGLGKLWWRKSHSVDISTPDPEFKVSYLGNVLTGWAKGEGCVEKQLSTLWRNYTQNTKPDVIMRIKVCASGLKATTRQHGLTEYWSNRITHCCAPKNYPRVFCWIYRHEGRKLKHELRCHAVLCSKEKIVQDICNTLKENLECALRDFKREKILKQNARLSLANAAYENPSLPRRKILLSVGGNNYRPPLERSKSAPKLMAIEEAIGEEEGEEIEETNEPEMKPCCQKDSLYPAMTLGRRRCRRGHSIRRTGKTRPAYCTHVSDSAVVIVGKGEGIAACEHSKENDVVQQVGEAEEQRHSFGSDDSDDFDKLLKFNDYDATSSLTNELLPYFDMQLHMKTSCSLGSLTELKDEEEEPLSLTPTINCDPSADPQADFRLDISPVVDANETLLLGLRRDGICSDGEEEDFLEEEDDMYFRQASILNMLHRSSMRKMANLSMSSDESSIDTNASLSLQYVHQIQSSISSNASSTATSASGNETTQDSANSANTQRKHGHAVDSDEGSISSGCETASTVTANQDDISLRYRQDKQLLFKHTIETNELMLEQALPEEDHPITVEEIYQRLESRLHGRHNSDATTFSSSSSITLKLSSSPTPSMKGSEGGTLNNRTTRKMRRQVSAAAQTEQSERQHEDSDSECSDESGYVEFQERDSVTKSNTNQAITKPTPPPKPLPRRIIGTGTSTAV